MTLSMIVSSGKTRLVFQVDRATFEGLREGLEREREREKGNKLIQNPSL